MGMPLHNEAFEIGDRDTGTLESELASQVKPPQHLSDFNIDELRGMKALGGIQNSRSDAVGLRRPQYQLNGSGRVQNDQRESRSERNTSVGDNLPA